LQAGDRVRVSLRGRRLAAFAALAYGMPLAGLLGGAVLATVWMPGAGDGVAVIGALAGAGAAGLLISLDVVRRSTVAALPAVVQRIE
jgi:positive regulator of sigma E activity